MLNLAGQAQEPLSLSGLHDIALPPEPPLWPPAPGWWALGATLLFSGIVCAVQLLRRHRALAYRRAALGELAALTSTGDLTALPALLKRVALAIYPRREVAALSGSPWLDFLARTGGFDEAAGQRLLRLAYGGSAESSPSAPPRATDEQLIEAARSWIRAQGPRASEEAR